MPGWPARLWMAIWSIYAIQANQFMDDHSFRICLPYKWMGETEIPHYAWVVNEVMKGHSVKICHLEIMTRNDGCNIMNEWSARL